MLVVPVQAAKLAEEKVSEKIGDSASTLIDADGWLFALGGLLRLSTASTAYVCEDPGVRPVLVKLVAVVVPIGVERRRGTPGR